MGRPFGLLRVAQRPQRLLEELLQVRLPNVDDVVGRGRMSERQDGRLRPESPTSTRARCRQPAC